MKTMTCSQLGGACDKEFQAETFEEMAELSKQHGMEMFQQGEDKLMATKTISSGVVHTVPADLRDALTADSKALTVWEDLTPLARNEWICWVISVKKQETRNEHVERVRNQLKEGKRRPCCWYGCIHRTDKPVSPSVQNLVLKR